MGTSSSRRVLKAGVAPRLRGVNRTLRGFIGKHASRESEWPATRQDTWMTGKLVVARAL